MSERTRLEEIRKRDAVLHPSWFTVDDTDDCGLRVDQTLAARAIKDRRWLLEREREAEALALNVLAFAQNRAQNINSDKVRTILIRHAQSVLAALHAKETDRG